VAVELARRQEVRERELVERRQSEEATMLRLRAADPDTGER
jgi:hypothetical protein